LPRLKARLPKPEIYTHLVRAMGCMPPDERLAALRDVAGAAIWWPAAHQCTRESRDAVIAAGFEGECPAFGEALFLALIERPSGGCLHT
jgi:hypothetical protein